MAISSSMVWEIRPGSGNANNGGGFRSGASGTDYSQQDSAQVSYTDLVIDSATNTNITSAAHPFDSSAVGNLIKITAGMGFTTGYYEVVSVSGVVATLDRSVGTIGSTGGTGYLGGAAASTMNIAASVVTGNYVWIKSGTDTLTSNSVFTGGTKFSPIFIEGYNSIRGDLSSLSWNESHDAYQYLEVTNYPLIGGVSSTYRLETNGFIQLRCLNLDNNALSYGFYAANTGPPSAWRVRFRMRNSTYAIGSIGSGIHLIDCDIIRDGGSGTYCIVGSQAYCSFSSCRIKNTGSNTNIGIGGIRGSIVNCIFDVQGIAYAATTEQCTLINNTIVGSQSAITLSNSSNIATIVLINNIITGCVNGVNNRYSATSNIMIYSYNNRMRNTNNYIGVIGYSSAAPGDITTPQSDTDEYIDYVNKDFRLRSTSYSIGSGMPPYTDIGALQSQPTTSSSGGYIPIRTSGINFWRT